MMMHAKTRVVSFFFTLILLIASIVSAEGRKLPGRWPWAISMGVQPRLFLRFQMSVSAPWSARNCTSLVQLL